MKVTEIWCGDKRKVNGI